MIKQSLALILSLTLSGCASFRSGEPSFIDQGPVKERGIIQTDGDFFEVPIPSSPKVVSQDKGYGVFFTLSNGDRDSTYVVSGKLDDLEEIHKNLGNSKRATIEFYNHGGYKSLPDSGTSTNRYFFNLSIKREDCFFTYELRK